MKAPKYNYHQSSTENIHIHYFYNSIKDIKYNIIIHHNDKWINKNKITEMKCKQTRIKKCTHHEDKSI